MSPSIRGPAIMRFLLRWSLRACWMLAVQVLLALMLLLVWLAASESAPRWLWQQVGSAVPGLTIKGIEGRFLTGVSMSSLHWQNDRLDVSATDLKLAWLPTHLAKGSLDIAEAHARHLIVRQRLKPDETSEPLPRLHVNLPFAWFLHDLSIARLTWQAWQTKPVNIDRIALSASGAGSQVTLDSLTLSGFDAHLQASGHVTLQDYLPLRLLLSVRSDVIPWRQQNITLTGDLQALRFLAQGPSTWPLSLDATLKVVPARPAFSASLSWPSWSLAGQPDWQVQAGSLKASGDVDQGQGRLDLSLRLKERSTLPWPKTWPRLATLAGPFDWQFNAGAARVGIAWQGRFGGMPWQLSGRYRQADPTAAMFDMQLADSRITVKGMPATGTRIELIVPALQRFQPEYAGAVQASGEWRGLASGSGRIRLRADGLKKAGQSLWQQLAITLRGSLRDQITDIRFQRKDLALQAMLQGRLSLQPRPEWQGRLLSAALSNPMAGAWQLQSPSALRLSAVAQTLDRQCWVQATYRLCADASLDSSRWLARLALEGGELGSAGITLRRDPTVASPPLDADVILNALNLQALPVKLPPGLSLTGLVTGKLQVTGHLEQPRANGNLTLLNGRMAFPDLGLDWRPINLQALFTGDRVSWAGDWRDTQQGRGSISGNALLGTRWQASMRVQGEQLSAALQPVARLQFTPDLTLDARSGAVKIRGRILVPQARITLEDIKAKAAKPSADAVIVVDRQGNDPRLETTPLDAVAMDADVTVLMGKDVRVSGRGLEASLQGQLALTQRADTLLAANGELRLGADAFFEAYGQRLDIRTGRFLFAGPIGRPDINLEAIRVVEDITVGLRITGRSPNTSAALFADQPLTQEEMLSYLILGRSLSNTQTPTPAEQQALALGAALKFTGRTGVFDKVGSTLGIDDFALSTEGSSSDTKVAISGSLTSRLFLSFGIGLFDQSQAVKLRYKLSPRLSIEALSALESAVTVFYTFRR